MAKTRHHKLRDQMAAMVADMNAFFQDLHLLLRILPNNYYWKYGKLGLRPLTQRTQNVLNLVDSATRNTIFSKYASGDSDLFLISRTNLKNNSRATKAIGISRVPHKQNDKAFVEKCFYQAFLYCCDYTELGTHSWFQEENTCDSFIHQLRSISAIYREEFILESNLTRHPYPIFQDAIHAWKMNPDCPDAMEKGFTKTITPNKSTSTGSITKAQKYKKHPFTQKLPDEIKIFSALCHSLTDINCPDTIENEFNAAISPHEPSANCTIAQAWEYVQKTLKEGKHRKIEKFLQLYLTFLEETIFHQIPWSSQQKYYWLKEWEDKLFRRPPSTPRNAPGRWQQGNALDYIKAAKLIRYFVENFLQNPKDLKSAEVACILWLMLWCAYHHLSDIKETDVINLTTDNFLTGGKLKLRNHSFTISQGLLNLLTPLFGTGRGTREKEIFSHIRNEKALARALKEASKVVLGNDETPITPSAFLNFPHIWPEMHLSRKVRDSMRNTRHIIEPKLPEKYISEAKKIISRIRSK